MYACDHVHRLRLWFKCSRSDALDIVALKLLQVQKQLPWESKNLKGRAALEKEYDHYLRDYLPELEETFRENDLDPHPDPKPGELEALLTEIGADNLIGYPHLLAILPPGSEE